MSNEMTFEQALSRLEQIVKALESGNVPLEDLIKLFDEGTGLVKLCTERLDAAEEKVKL
ncbi:MAG: exodeoxyribonuclease VII small subunit, partial [Clostridia bacterium]|nr:exodeoxyribonuclease VII small subunit [Clostridia bacterium]